MKQKGHEGVLDGSPRVLVRFLKKLYLWQPFYIHADFFGANLVGLYGEIIFVGKHFELGQVAKMLKGWSIFSSDSHFVKYLFDLILMSQSTIFRLCQDRSSWVEPVIINDNVSCSRAQHSHTNETRTGNPSVLIHRSHFV